MRLKLGTGTPMYNNEPIHMIQRSLMHNPLSIPYLAYGPSMMADRESMVGVPIEIGSSKFFSA